MEKKHQHLADRYLLTMSDKYGKQFGLGESLLRQMTKLELNTLFSIRRNGGRIPTTPPKADPGQAPAISAIKWGIENS